MKQLTRISLMLLASLICSTPWSLSVHAQENQQERRDLLAPLLDLMTIVFYHRLARSERGEVTELEQWNWIRISDVEKKGSKTQPLTWVNLERAVQPLYNLLGLSFVIGSLDVQRDLALPILHRMHDKPLPHGTYYSTVHSQLTAMLSEIYLRGMVQLAQRAAHSSQISFDQDCQALLSRVVRSAAEAIDILRQPTMANITTQINDSGWISKLAMLDETIKSLRGSLDNFGSEFLAEVPTYLNSSLDSIVRMALLVHHSVQQSQASPESYQPAFLVVQTYPKRPLGLADLKVLRTTDGAVVNLNASVALLLHNIVTLPPPNVDLIRSNFLFGVPRLSISSAR